MEESISHSSPLRTFRADQATVEIYPSKPEAGKAAAIRAASILKTAIAKRGRARLIMATGNSQQDLILSLAQDDSVDWSRVDLFHMDEYIGLPLTNPGCLRSWINTRFLNVVQPGSAHFIDGNAPDVDAECRRYEQLIREAPITLCMLGFGENGHIAFNEPHVADFHDPRGVRRVDLDERDRSQQAGEGHFPGFESVPREAITLTCPLLMSSENIIGCVSELRKAEAVKNALEGPVSTKCPGSIVRTHPQAHIYLDADAASQLSS